MQNQKRVEYLAAARRAAIDYRERSLVIARRDDSRRHERQALQHARRADYLAQQILVAVGAV